MSGADVTVIVPVWNRRELLERLLCGLRAQTHAHRPKCWWSTTAPPDGSAEVAERLGARVIRMGAHGGFARAVNRGIRESRTPLLAIVNNDVELAPDWLEQLLAALEDATPGSPPARFCRPRDRGRIDGTFDAVCRGGTRLARGTWLPGWAGVPRTAREIWSAPLPPPCFAPDCSASGAARRAFRIVPGRRGFRAALRAGRTVRAGTCRKRSPGTAAAPRSGRWHPETTRRIARNQVFLVAKHYPRASAPALRLAHPGGPGSWGLVALRHGARLVVAARQSGRVAAVRRVPHRATPATEQYRFRNSCAKASERSARVQRKCGRDLYWTLYFLLTAEWGK